MTKRATSLGLRVSEDEREALIAAARRAGMSLSDYVRKLAGETRPTPPAAVATAAPTAKPPPAKPLPEFGVDDIGPDPFYRDNGASKR